MVRLEHGATIVSSARRPDVTDEDSSLVTAYLIGQAVMLVIIAAVVLGHHLLTTAI